MSDPISKMKKRLQEEIDTLQHELRIELPKELAKARAHGDLSENAEYKFAKERQGYVNARITQLKKRMGDLGMLNLNNIPKDRAGYGSRIVAVARAVLRNVVQVQHPEGPRGLRLANRRVGHGA